MAYRNLETAYVNGIKPESHRTSLPRRYENVGRTPATEVCQGWARSRAVAYWHSQISEMAELRRLMRDIASLS